MIENLVHTEDIASCSTADPELFFPEKGGQPTQAKRLCASCPLLAPCWDYAIHHTEMGIWAGMTENERMRYRTKNGIVPIRAPRLMPAMTSKAIDQRKRRAA